MKIRLKSLHLVCKKSVEIVNFSDVSYFRGPMGTGKSTIARLIDYCLGSRRLDMTPALQNEFVSAKLTLTVGETELSLERVRESPSLTAQWSEISLQIPARDATGILLPGTNIEILSDIFFHLIGKKPHITRRSQIDENSSIKRLTLRDLLMYCYLDQENLDSSFFNLDRTADQFRRLSSRVVLSTVIGTHQEKVAELETQIEELRQKRETCRETANILKTTLEEVGVEDFDRLQDLESQCHDRLRLVDKEIQMSRSKLEIQQTHVTDSLRKEARSISEELRALEISIDQIIEIQDDDKRHLNEMLGLAVKVQKMHVANEILRNISFVRCPCCNQSLRQSPSDGDRCSLCGQDILQEDTPATDNGINGDRVVEVDIKNRISELKEMIERQNVQLARMKKRHKDFSDKKREVDDILSQKMKRYDSQYLAAALEHERNRVKITEELKYIQRIIQIVKRSNDLIAEGERLYAEERQIRQKLKQLREKAAKDVKNLRQLSRLFLDCLVRSNIPGFESTDSVRIVQPWFLPEVEGSDTGELVQTSFSNLGSGGKKNLFKCCFAIAFHRLATELSSLLPTLLIIDSPMKNISERENRKQFEAFHELLYNFANTELRGTQIIIIDKEYYPPKEQYNFSFSERLMTLNDPNYPPLIGYYRGK